MKTASAHLRGMVGTLALLLPARALPPADSVADDSFPCKVHQQVRIAFPVRALSEGVVRGEVVLMLEVDHTGLLTDILAIGYTRREFADSALFAVRQWRFTPGRIAGQAVGSTITLNVQFEAAGVVAYVKPVEFADARDPLGEGLEYRPVNPAALDRLPVPLSRASPVYPREWIVQKRTGTVIVDFFIDEKGQVRFPHIVEQTDPFLGATALAAVRDWRFSPPSRQGRPVLTRAQQMFHFQPPTPETGFPRAR